MSDLSDPNKWLVERAYFYEVGVGPFERWVVYSPENHTKGSHKHPQFHCWHDAMEYADREAHAQH